MSEHLNLSDIIEAASVKKMTQESMALFARIHSHIADCKECKTLYENAVKLTETLEELPDSMLTISPQSKENVILSLPVVIREGVAAVSEFLLGKIRQYKGTLLFDFSYPAAMGTRSADVKAARKKNKIIDENDNRNQIEILPEGAICARLALPDAKSVIMTISSKDGSAAIIEGICLNGIWTMRCDHPPQGECTLNFIQK